MKCPNCGGAMRPGGLDYDLCAKCGPVRTVDLSELPPDWQTMDMDQLMDHLQDSFELFLQRLERMK